MVRSLQDEALAGGYEGFTAFIPWSYKRGNTPLAKRVKEESGPNPYLRMIAMSRIYLDNIQHIQASWFSEGKKTSSGCSRCRCIVRPTAWGIAPPRL